MTQAGRTRQANVHWAWLVTWYWVPVIAYAVLIHSASALPIPEESLPSFLKGLNDKVIHMLEFGLLGILSYRAFANAAGTRAASHALVLGMGLAIFYGLTDELHQSFVPEREADAWDVLADATGVIFATVLWHRWVQKREGPASAGA